MGTLKKSKKGYHPDVIDTPFSSKEQEGKDDVVFKKVSSEELLKRRVGIYPYFI